MKQSKVSKWLIKVYNNIASGFKKYPIPSTIILLSTFLGLILSYTSKYSHNFNSFDYFVLRLFMATHLIIPATLAISLTVNLSKKVLDKKKGLYAAIFFTIITLLIAYVFIIFPWNYNVYESYASSGLLTYRYIALLVLPITSIFILPFISKLKGNDKNNSVNKSLWAHILQTSNGFIAAFIYGLVTFIGLALALAAIKELWRMNINEWTFLAAAVISFNLVAYLRLTNSINSITNLFKTFKLSKVTEVFAKYILLPLTTLYTIILFRYIVINILIFGEWTDSLMTPLSLVFIALVFTTLIILFFDKISGFIKKLPVLAIPVILVQIYGLWLRVDAYGLTVNRVELILLAILFLILSIYFTIVKNPKLIVIPITLALFAVLTPLSFWVSKQDQIDRHIEVMKTYGFVNEDGIITPSEEVVDLAYESESNIADGFTYLIEYHKLSSLEDILDSEVYRKVSEEDSSSRYNKRQIYLDSLNISVKDYWGSYDYENENESLHYFYSLNTSFADFENITFPTSLNSMTIVNDIEVPTTPIPNGLEIEVKDETYIILDSDMDILTSEEFNNPKVILLDNKYDDSALLIFEAEIIEDSDSNEYTITTVKGWIINKEE